MAVNHHPGAQWFREAGLGMFLHWGIGSLTGNDISWSMMKDKPWCKGYDVEKFTPEEYWKLAETFNPVSYDPDKWLAAAREAGMDYAVLTAKHHDGYTLWPSEYGDLGVKQYLNGRDLVGEFIDACRRQGLKVGIYFSLSDWYHPDTYEPDHYESFQQFHAQPLQNADDIVRFERFYTYVKGQVKELITRYGKIDLFWFDGDIWNKHIDNRMNDIYSMIRAVQPHIVINDRGGAPELGDYRTPECQLSSAPIQGWWEACYIWQNGGWGYDPQESYKDLNWTLKLLATVAGGGGNLLLNVGPRPDGELPSVVYERFAELKEWMQRNRSSVKGVERAIWPPKCSQPVTRRENTWYIHVLAEDTGMITIKEVPEPVKVSLLRNGKTLGYTYKAGNFCVEVPKSERVSGDEVVTVTWRYAEEGYRNEVFQFAE
jgi:alpha-L-fucosidase